MKNVIILLVTTLLFQIHALSAIPLAQITFRVTDDEGVVVTNATIQMTTFEKWIPGPEFGKDIRSQVDGVTDTNGQLTLTIPSLRGSVKYGISVGGEYYDKTMKMKINGNAYYRDQGGSYSFTNEVAGKWQPWDPVVNIVLKPVADPIPMYARFLDSWSFKVPEFNIPLGYDLIKSDWLPPYGDGEIADFIFTLHAKLGDTREDGIQLFDAELILTFSNNGDGIQELEFTPREGSVLSMPRIAPTGGYSTKWTSRTYAHENDDSCEYRESQCFIYRVRTKKNTDGEITSALYGKILGPIFYEVRANGASMQMKYFLNPTPNDRNLEFDPSKNLFKNLSPLEEVREP